MDSSMYKIIRNALAFHSSLPFQNKGAIILKEYYKYKGFTYENPNPAGGDDKNDGWVKEKGIYYQIYSPTNYSGSFANDVFKKFKSDAEGLFENVYVHNLWKKPINEFIFIVNTRDQSIPKDSIGICQKCIDDLNKTYNANASYKLENVDYFLDLMQDIDNEKIEKNILMKLDVDDMVKYSNIDENVMIKFLDLLSSNIQENIYNNNSSDYVRISSEKKITLNSLDKYKEKINIMITKLSIVENAISLYEKQNPMDNVTNRTTNLVINLYNELKDKYVGTDLYDEILLKIIELTPQLMSFKYPAEFFMIYIFDKCDIFEKEIKK